MKRIVKLLMPILLLLLIAPHSGEAKLYGKQPPDDWNHCNVLRITVFQMGESDGMLLECGGEAMLVDGGSNKYREVLQTELTRRDLAHIKYFFNSHPHDDHIDGLYRVMQSGFTADAFLSPFAREFEYNLHQRAVAAADAAGIPFQHMKAGDRIMLGDAQVTLYQWMEGASINDMSGMLKVNFGNASLLLCADITGRAQHYFLETLETEELKADVVKAPHHGITPFVKPFLDAVDPQLVFVTNSSKKVKGLNDQIQYRGLPCMYSGHETIILETDGEDWYAWYEK